MDDFNIPFDGMSEEVIDKVASLREEFLYRNMNVDFFEFFEFFGSNLQRSNKNE